MQRGDLVLSSASLNALCIIIAVLFCEMVAHCLNGTVVLLVGIHCNDDGDGVVGVVNATR